MKRLLPSAIVIVFAVLAFSLSHAQVTINQQGAGTPANDHSPVAVGTNTPVVVIPAAARDGRCNWKMRWTEAGNLSCQPIYYNSPSPAVTPTTTHGYLLLNGTQPDANSLTDDPTVGWSCVSTTGTLNIYTLENAHCSRTTR